MTEIEKMKKAISFLLDCSDVAEGTEFSDYYAMGATALREKLERSENNGWISVEERLPEPETEVIAFTIDGNVTHWQPLPSPPKEESQCQP